MASSTNPIIPSGTITPKMVADARRALGACHQCIEKLFAFKSAGYEFPDQESVVDDIARKAQGVLAAAEMQVLSESNGNGLQLPV